jgi:hypothetical protein
MQLPDRLGPWRVETDLATVAAWQPHLEPPLQATTKKPVLHRAAATAALASILASVNAAIREHCPMVENCQAIL